MEKPKITDVSSKVFDLLTPFDSEERRRVIQAALTLLGESHVTPPPPAPAHGNSAASGGESADGLPTKAQAWMKQYGFTLTDIESVFHVENGNVDVIAASLPGKNTKERAHNAYVLLGIGKLLATGDTSFDDKAARALCNAHGSYDRANHAVYMKGIDNKITGSKDRGWKLTSPGLAHGATLIKELTKKS
jgi:hypothetical protein